MQKESVSRRTWVEKMYLNVKGQGFFKRRVASHLVLRFGTDLALSTALAMSLGHQNGKGAIPSPKQHMHL